MGQVEPNVRGELGRHPLARRFADEIARVHTRYADEVVTHFQLCPFLRDAETGFGRFCVLLDLEPRLEEALAAAREVESAVIHIVFPCVRTPGVPFERFAARFGEELRRIFKQDTGAAGGLPGIPMPSKAPVLASFHPEMAGDESSSHRLVGLLRRAPDPFIQLIPPGLSSGGTVFAGAGVDPGEDPVEATFTRLQSSGFGALRAKIEEIHADRDASYAPYLEALGLAGPGPRFDGG